MVFILLVVWIGGIVIRCQIEKRLSDMQIENLRITCEEVEVNLFRRSLTLNGIEIKSDEQNHSAHSPIAYLDARIRQISGSGISLRKLINKVFDFKKLLVDSPHATVVMRSGATGSEKENSPEKKGFPPIAIGDFRLIDGSFDWKLISGSDTLQCRIAGVNTGMQRFALDSLQRVTLGAKSAAGVDSIRYTFANRSYLLAVNSIRWNGAEQYLSVSDLALIPQYSKWEFPRKSARKADYMELGAQNLTISGLHTDRLWNDKTVEADSLHLSAGHLTSSKDRNADVPVRVKPMIHTLIQQLGIPIDIRRIKVDDFDATYEETAPGRTAPGQVTFEQIDATFTGFTNIVKGPDQYIGLQATALLMGKGKMSAEISLPIDPANDRFDVKTTSHATSLPSLNRIIRPLTGIEIQSGNLDRLDFHLAGNSISADAAMTMRYHDLKIELLKMKEGEWKERDGLSNLANWALIREENPDRNGTRKVQTTVQRDPHRSAFNYLWKGVSAGALETVESGVVKTVRGN